MDDDSEIPLGGKRVRVFANVIQQAIDYLEMSRRDYVTLVAVGEGAVLNAIAVYTGDRPSRLSGLLTHETPVSPPPARPREQQPRAGAAVKTRKKRRTSQPRESFVDEILSIIDNAGEGGISAVEISDTLGLPRGEMRSRAAVTHTLAELRYSGIVDVVRDERMPSYVMRKQLRPLENPEVSEEAIVQILREYEQPLAIGVICDLAGLPRTDRPIRTRLGLMANAMHRAGKLTRHLASGNIAIYGLNENA